MDGVEETAMTTLQSPPTSVPPADGYIAGDKEKEEQGAGQRQSQLQALLDLDDSTVTKQAAAYLFSMPLGVAPDDEDFWSYCEEPQLTELNRRLALYRIKDHLFLTTGKEVDIAELEEQYPVDILKGQGYFEHLEASLGWYYYPEHTKIAGLDDYQRLVLRNDGDYANWVSYSLTYHTYQGDLDYVRYCDEMSKEIKWIKDKVGLDEELRRKYESRACLQAMKIGSGFHNNLFRHSVLNGYMDYVDSIQFDFNRRKDFDRIYLEIWKRVAKEKYDTYVAWIDEKISEEDCHLLIIGSMKKMFPEPKTCFGLHQKENGSCEAYWFDSTKVQGKS